MTAKIITALTLTLSALTLTAHGEQRVSGIIDREVRWRAEDGPYIVTGDILVTRLGNLVIAPGTHIIIGDDAQKGNLAAPFDKADSTLVSIRVQGSIESVGRRNNPIVFEPEKSELANFKWRGIIIEDVDARHSEIAFTEVSGAATGLTLKNAGILVRNNALENNNIGIHIVNGGAPKIYNNLMTSCFTAAVKVENANPRILNNIIAFNKNLGLWCDNLSKITFKYNCVFGNADGNFLDCDPELGMTALAGKQAKDSADANGNIISDPVFVGSPAETRAIELDINLQTDTSQVKDKRLIHLPNFQFGPPPKREPTLIGAEGRELSKPYSPCINAGDPGGMFKNMDGSRNTMGPAGGPDFMTR